MGPGGGRHGWVCCSCCGGLALGGFELTYGCRGCLEGPIPHQWEPCLLHGELGHLHTRHPVRACRQVRKCLECASQRACHPFGGLGCQDPVVEGDRCGLPRARGGDQDHVRVIEGAEMTGRLAEAGSQALTLSVFPSLRCPQARPPGAPRLLERRRGLLRVGREAPAHRGRVGVQLPGGPARQVLGARRASPCADLFQTCGLVLVGKSI